MARTPAPSPEQRLNALEQRVGVLESERPGRKPKPMLAIRQRDVCALDPTRDSHTCPDSSIYRYQSGCHGAACRLRQHEAYERRKNNKATKAVAKPVKSARKLTAVKPTPTKKARPTKKAAVKKTTPSKRVAKRLAS